MEVPAPTPTPARPSKREIAKEYALKVPKPRMREATAQEADGVSASAPGSPAPQRDDEEVCFCFCAHPRTRGLRNLRPMHAPASPDACSRLAPCMLPPRPMHGPAPEAWVRVT